MGNSVTKQANILVGYTQDDGEQEQRQLSVKTSSMNKFHLDLSHHSIILLADSLNFSASIRVLNLSHNKISHIPDIFDQLPHLISLDISSNQLSDLPASVSTLHKLIEIKAQRNKFTSLPEPLLALENLMRANFSSNLIENITPNIKKLESLSVLKLDHNLIKYLPTELNLIKLLREVTFEGCPLITDFPKEEKKQTVPSLKELSARVIIQHNTMNPTAFNFENLPGELENYLQSFSICSFCNGPYFENHTIRFRFLYKWGRLVPFAYHLCKGHWKTEKERVFEMFKPKPSVEPTFVPNQRRLSNNKLLERSKSSLAGKLEQKSAKTSTQQMRKAYSSSFVPLL